MRKDKMMNLQALKLLKEERHATNKSIADATGIPESTVARILNGQTDSPSFSAVVDIVRYLGGSLDEIAGIAKEQKCPQVETYEHEIQRLKESLAVMEKWLLRLFMVVVLLIATSALIAALYHFGRTF